MRRLISMVLTTLIFILLFSACTSGAEETDKDDMESVYKTISPADARELIGGDGVVLADVRTPGEYEEGYIPGTVLLPLDDIQQKAGSVLPDKSATVIVYCRSGRRSAIAAQELLDMGYKTVYDLGGIQSWPYDTTS